MSKQENLSNYIDELISEILIEIEDEDIDESTATGDAAGYDTPNAFGDNSEKSKNKTRKVATQAGYTVIDNDVRNISEDKIPGGLAQGMTLRDIANKHKIDIDDLVSEFRKGIKAEMEHTTDVNISKEITLDHLFEDPKYYTKLSTIEESDKKRDHKAEYQARKKGYYEKYQSSTKSKKYRAELNQYNRKKGTYGNGDGLDASHKNGKIVGFETENANRSRKEKSRLKKENVNEELRPTELKKLAIDLAYSMPNHTKYDPDTGPTDSQIIKAFKYFPDLKQYTTTPQKKEVVKIVKKLLAESLDIQFTQLMENCEESHIEFKLGEDDVLLNKHNSWNPDKWTIDWEHEDRSDSWMKNKHNLVPVNETITENRWLAMKNDESMHSHKKLAVGLRELRNQLMEVERFLGWYNKLKNINELESDNYWKRTKTNIYKIKERIINIARTLKEIEK